MKTVEDFIGKKMLVSETYRGKTYGAEVKLSKDSAEIIVANLKVIDDKIVQSDKRKKALDYEADRCRAERGISFIGAGDSY